MVSQLLKTLIALGKCLIYICQFLCMSLRPLLRCKGSSFGLFTLGSDQYHNQLRDNEGEKEHRIAQTIKSKDSMGRNDKDIQDKVSKHNCQQCWPDSP